MAAIQRYSTAMAVSNVSFYPYYRPRIIPFLEQGGVWVLANIRGGGEFWEGVAREGPTSIQAE